MGNERTPAELVGRLRRVAQIASLATIPTRQLMNQAADEIERLREVETEFDQLIKLARGGAKLRAMLKRRDEAAPEGGNDATRPRS